MKNLICIKIEELRQKLVQITNEKGFSDPNVIALSQKLDEVINIYYLSSINNNKKTAV